METPHHLGFIAIDDRFLARHRLQSTPENARRAAFVPVLLVQLLGRISRRPGASGCVKNYCGASWSGFQACRYAVYLNPTVGVYQNRETSQFDPPEEGK